ncbi:Enoyl-CoA hydratase [Paraburkholderia caribensis MBA4]|uniref:Enoyl-CoA hydratase n=1 Tax=Paraburkholderia caribensis MBA4 TaxID=1323664 RepID=A0A0P0RIA4_9BURK|nr:enoyl-CoA hydratase-related protein [Paraburkholderia caribensis]ALL68383.1 Enoyl-CoA hydratase [Paraburkholderia caribensis MBA4]
MDTHISSELVGNVWTIGINRADQQNALTATLFDALANALQLAQSDVRVNSVLIHGTSTCFCAGHDVAGFGSLWPYTETGAVGRCIRAFATQPKPLVAAVNGLAAGFGATVLLHADYIVAGEGAVFQFPYADSGTVPEAASTALLSRRVGDLRAREWLISGRQISADEAHSSGFISKVVADSSALSIAKEYAHELASKPPSALQATRRLISDGMTRGALEAIDAELNYLVSHVPAGVWKFIPHT